MEGVREKKGKCQREGWKSYVNGGCEEDMTDGAQTDVEVTVAICGEVYHKPRSKKKNAKAME